MNTAHRLPLIETKFADDFPEWQPARRRPRGMIVRIVREAASLAVVCAAIAVFIAAVGRFG